MAKPRPRKLKKPTCKKRKRLDFEDLYEQAQAVTEHVAKTRVTEKSSDQPSGAKELISKLLESQNGTQVTRGKGDSVKQLYNLLEDEGNGMTNLATSSDDDTENGSSASSDNDAEEDPASSSDSDDGDGSPNGSVISADEKKPVKSFASFSPQERADAYDEEQARKSTTSSDESEEDHQQSDADTIPNSEYSEDEKSESLTSNSAHTASEKTSSWYNSVRSFYQNPNGVTITSTEATVTPAGGYSSFKINSGAGTARFAVDPSVVPTDDVYLDDAVRNSVPNNMKARWQNFLFPRLKKEEGQWRQLAHQHGRLAPVTDASSSVIPDADTGLLIREGRRLFAETVAAGTLFRSMQSYADVYFTEQSLLTAPAVRDMAALHIANHFIRTKRYINRVERRLRALRKERKLLVAQETANVDKTKIKRKRRRLKPGEKMSSEDFDTQQKRLNDEENALRYCGFTNARVLVLMPTRQAAREFIETILALLPGIRRVHNRDAFEGEFTCEPAFEPESDRHVLEIMRKKKPVDYVQFFHGHSDDAFRIGIQFKPSRVELFTSLCDADIIVASPIGLRLLMGSDGQLEGREVEFLSSIEILLLDRTDALIMQNWDFLQNVIQVVNLQPKIFETPVDIRRLKSGYLDGNAAALRQTIILSQGRRPEVEALLRENCRNVRGLIRLSSPSKGVVARRAATLLGKVVLMHLPCMKAADKMKVYAEFLQKSFPPPFLGRDPADSILLVVPGFPEYLQVRKALKKSLCAAADGRELDRFVSVHEYSSRKAIREARSAFHQGLRKLLVTTERFVFFRRSQFRGASQVIFLGAPVYPETFVTLTSFLKNRSAGIACIVYSKLDAAAIERCVGAERLAPFLRAPDTGTKLFVLGL